MTEALDRAVGITAFGADVAGYAAGRLDYPDALFEALADHCGLGAGISVLEIGPGTGQATRRLLDAGVARVTAVEPDPALAAHLRDWGEARLDVDQRAFGPAIAGDHSFDLIVAATSFHWLESASALCDVRRLLKPRGAFAMWWNVFQEPGEDRLFNALFDGLARPPSLLTGRHYSLDSKARCTELAAAGLVDVAHVMLRRTVAMTPAALRQLFSTFSAVRNLPADRREARLDAVEQQALRERGERFDRIFRTPLYTARSPG
ncbi:MULTISPECIES: class I SAM-dependent methyltransferase [unclassified Sphingopyxis]|uniref:class I SAM-dependent methyltransferase n=1 Tax=unclassified Sphingopyxis TaxID=2614943 RepID=UPI000735E903|nr:MULTISPECIES: class I SAM-dependent methyltransferase [unclassified Sphingopyxis]KTE38402.1 hypothetical protein ATE62_11340 [Sphingopyxis sp. HIX]KTE84188.1 hypothetical protein ATE72_10265 [Sphingopyxis sp. HXXIV]